jgi:hypothetical protein
MSVSILTTVHRAMPPAMRVFILDVQTGVVVNNTKSHDIGMLHGTLACFFRNHRTIAFLGRDGTFHTYDGVDGTHMCVGRFGTSSNFQLDAPWVHEESLQFPTSLEINGEHVVNIWKLLPVATPPLFLINSFPV